MLYIPHHFKVYNVSMITQSYKQVHAQYKARKYLPLQPCEVCGVDKNIHRHHPDYDKPLEVMYLCPLHHARWHSKNTAKNYTKLPLLPSTPEVHKEAKQRLVVRYRRQAKKITTTDLEYIHAL